MKSDIYLAVKKQAELFGDCTESELQNRLDEIDKMVRNSEDYDTSIQVTERLVRDLKELRKEYERQLEEFSNNYDKYMKQE